MNKPIDAAAIPRRDPLIQSAIEALQDADDAMRRGESGDIELIVALSVVQTLLGKATR